MDMLESGEEGVGGEVKEERGVVVREGKYVFWLGKRYV